MAMKKGLLVMAYGTPYKEEDIEPYYTHIRHGRKPSEEALQDLKDRYEAIGGISPLADTTKRQAEALVNKLNASQSEVEYELFIGLKHIDPFIEDAVESMSDHGIKEAVSVVLAPHYSEFSVGSYNKRAKAEGEKYGISIKSVESFYEQEPFIDFWTEAVKSSLMEIPEAKLQDTAVIVSAHSLPEKIKEHNDPYPAQLEETAELIRKHADLQNVHVGWQSEGNTPDPWLGPDVQDLTRDLHRAHGYSHFIYLPVGFVCEHLEVLYDNDYECKLVCDEVGAGYHRPAMPNTDDRFIQAMINEINKL
ncbi:ferrochelatase [Salinicoccus sediminis]|uniref:Coproporphyrin III ferrochelatase n=1 Tax=Salinicoccus sediminis TaxID=1432562 RepID=A0A0M2SQD6_9STAP|nr:ferrochelatase [Salinicoccus sediminis]KKK35861.1 ferrochelatase [Salinicoccus sediminis]